MNPSGSRDCHHLFRPRGGRCAAGFGGTGALPVRCAWARSASFASTLARIRAAASAEIWFGFTGVAISTRVLSSVRSPRPLRGLCPLDGTADEWFPARRRLFLGAAFEEAGIRTDLLRGASGTSGADTVRRRGASDTSGADAVRRRGASGTSGTAAVRRRDASDTSGTAAVRRRGISPEDVAERRDRLPCGTSGTAGSADAVVRAAGRRRERGGAVSGASERTVSGTRAAGRRRAPRGASGTAGCAVSGWLRRAAGG